MTRSTTGGSVRRIPDRDLWQARYTDAYGRRHAVYGKTRREAQERLRVALRAKDQGIGPVSQELTVNAFLTDWLVTIDRRLRPRTAESYRGMARLYIIPSLGRIPLAKLQPEHISRMLADLEARVADGRIDPKRASGSQERLENLVNQRIWSVDR